MRCVEIDVCFANAEVQFWWSTLRGRLQNHFHLQTCLVCKCKSLKINFRQDYAVNQPTQFPDMCTYLSSGSLKERNHMGDLDINKNQYTYFWDKPRIPQKQDTRFGMYFIVMYVYSCCMFMYIHRASLHPSATLTEVFPCFYGSCKANAVNGHTTLKTSVLVRSPQLNNVGHG